MFDWLSAANRYQKDLVSFRRDFHQHPELGFEETRSSGIIAGELGRLGIEVTTGIAKTGVVGMIQGREPGKTVLLRFDMDALPIQEETEREYQSEYPGKMHACGHDGHMAIGLVTARILSEYRSEYKGTIKLVFQPAEEGAGGAERMIEEGILSDPNPDQSLAVHIWNEKPLGWLGITPGPVMAGADFFEIRIVGKGGHGAIPEKTIDPIIAAAQVINTLQTIVSRNVSPRDTAVVSITQVRGGEAYNVIPGSVELKGTIRSFRREVHDLLVKRIEDIAQTVSAGLGCDAAVRWVMADPPLVNNAMVTSVVQQVAREIFPAHEVDANYQSMGSEDMALIQERIPGCYVYVGSANPEAGLDYGHHHPRFDFDENVLPTACALLAGSAVSLLNQK